MRSNLGQAGAGDRRQEPPEPPPAEQVTMSCTSGQQLEWQRTDARNMRDHCSMKNNGKLQLAAVVHYNTMDRLGGQSEPTKHDNVRRGSANELKQTRPGQQVTVGEDSHVDAGFDEQGGGRRQGGARKPSGRLSRLFFTKHNTKKKIAHRQNGSHLIDNLPAKQGEQAQLEHTQRHWPDREQPGPPSDLGDGGGSGVAADGSGAPTLLSGAERRHPVIEFKFDLIVEGDREAAAAAGDDEILRPIRQRKLLDNVNELVESFVLDSMDACLLTAGRRRLQLASGGSSATDTDPGQCGRYRFNYLLKCAEISLTYAFQLLEATKTAPVVAGGCSPLRADGHSIELEAVLFEQQLDGSPIGIVDLLAAESDSASSASIGGGQVSFRECSLVSQALEALESIRSRIEARTTGGGGGGSQADDEFRRQRHRTPTDELTAPRQTNLILMVSMKLKQQVNGGSFTNRMCLLDVSEPKSSELTTIVESIFSGQALAHLKRQKLHLRALELQLADAAPASNSNNNNNKHHHQVASLTRLVRAEWLIYKQLSSALIKTLVIVHCHKLAPHPAAAAVAISPPLVEGPQAAPSQRLLVERHLMDYNLGLLEFVRRLQRASMSRLRRRKRHLRSNLAKSNLSLVSDTNLSVGSSTDREAQDLMISSPYRGGGGGGGGGDQLVAQAGGVRPAHWLPGQSGGAHLLNYSSCTRQHRHASRRGHHRAANHHHHHHHQHHRDRHSSSRHHAHQSQQRRPSRAASLNWRDSPTNELEATESSSPISTPSSGGNRHQSRLMSALDGCTHAKSTTARVWLPCSGGTPSQVPGLKRSLVVESDVDESIASLASTSLVSCQSAGRAGNFSGGSLLMSDPRTRRRLQQLHLDSPSDSNTIDDSIELQSFSSSSFVQPGRRATSPELDQWRDEPGTQPDYASDTCSVAVAEPPQQLKLEEFLNRLSNFIGPQLAAVASNQHRQPSDIVITQQQTAKGGLANQNNLLPNDDDDEDCKSHSSILEHLSSLTQESNLKMVKQQQQQQQLGPDRVSMVADDGQCDGRWPNGNSGHLQRLLRSTLRLQHKQQGQTDLADQLRALTIDCSDEREGAQKTSLASQRPELRNTTSSETPPASMESSCASSSSSSSSSSSYSRNSSNANQQRTLDNLYASVIRHQKTPQIKLP